MAQRVQFLAGANTSAGFCSCFSQVFAEKKRVFYLKGGPGVGKSSFMRQIVALLEKNQVDCCLFPCSSDPDSLDMVTAPQKSLAILDATAPHSYDPQYPGVRDTLISLGDYLNEKQLRENRGDIIRLNQKISQSFCRCYYYLAAAAEVRKVLKLSRTEKRELHTTAKAIAEKYFPRFTGDGSITPLFGASYTPKGLLEMTENLPQKTTVALALGLGETGASFCEELQTFALLRGLQVIALKDPLAPEDTAHLYLPQIGFLCTSSMVENPTETLQGNVWQKTTAFVDYEKSLCGSLTAEGMKELQKAKGLHDELEVYYTAAMNFDRWQEKLAAISRTIQEEILS